jgi:putative membrane protein
MTEFEWQRVVVAIHVIAMVAWMAGIFYLPRLFVYHADAEVGSDKSETFKVMERRLLTAIMRPAMIATWIAGLTLVIWLKYYQEVWMMLKFALVLGMTALHIWLAARQKDFEADRNTRTARTYRIVNEVPTLLLIGIILLVVIKPF